MYRQGFFLFLLFPYILLAQANQANQCQRQPDFIKTFKYNPKLAALTTSEKNKIGICLIAFDSLNKNNQPIGIASKVFQHPTWSKYGYLATITFDERGNVYTIPAPLISTLFNKPKEQNTIYQIDAISGVLKPWLNLGKIEKNTLNNPFGLLGITYFCHAQAIIASSVANSNRNNENGTIYIIQKNTKQILDTLQNIDAMGVCMDDDNNLYFGSARNGQLFSIPINTNGKFNKAEKKLVATLENIGPRGDDKPRKIKWVNNKLVVNGTAFNYNLTATSEKPETVYTFALDNFTNTWKLANMQ